MPRRTHTCDLRGPTMLNKYYLTYQINEIFIPYQRTLLQIVLFGLIVV